MKVSKWYVKKKSYQKDSLEQTLCLVNLFCQFCTPKESTTQYKHTSFRRKNKWGRSFLNKMSNMCNISIYFIHFLIGCQTYFSSRKRGSIPWQRHTWCPQQLQQTYAYTAEDSAMGPWRNPRSNPGFHE